MRPPQLVTLLARMMMMMMLTKLSGTRFSSSWSPSQLSPQLLIWCVLKLENRS